MPRPRTSAGPVRRRLNGKPPNRRGDARDASGNAVPRMPGSERASLVCQSTSPVAVGRYAVAWVAAAAVAVGCVVLMSHRTHSAPAADPVALAAQRAGCVVRSDAGGATPGALDVMQPPTFGPPAVPAATGVYSRPPRIEAVIGSLRRGVIVVQYRAATTHHTVLELRRLVALAPFRSIVTPDRTGMRYAVAATAWGRLIGCPHATPSAFVALHAFAMRYQGRGPDVPR
jgi:hypothetical protein